MLVIIPARYSGTTDKRKDKIRVIISSIGISTFFPSQLLSHNADEAINAPKKRPITPSSTPSPLEIPSPAPAAIVQRGQWAKALGGVAIKVPNSAIAHLIY